MSRSETAPVGAWLESVLRSGWGHAVLQRESMGLLGSWLRRALGSFVGCVAGSREQRDAGDVMARRFELIVDSWFLPALPRERSIGSRCSMDRQPASQCVYTHGYGLGRRLGRGASWATQ